MRRSASEIIRGLENRVARLERQSSTNRRARKYGKAITDAVRMLKKEVGDADASEIEVVVVELVHYKFEDLLREIEDRGPNAEEYYENEVVNKYPALVKAGILSAEIWIQHPKIIRDRYRLKNLKEVNLFAECIGARKLAEGLSFGSLFNLTRWGLS